MHTDSTLEYMYISAPGKNKMAGSFYDRQPLFIVCRCICFGPFHLGHNTDTHFSNIYTKNNFKKKICAVFLLNISQTGQHYPVRKGEKKKVKNKVVYNLYHFKTYN